MEPIQWEFVNKFQEDFFFNTKRNECASGGFGNGKTYVLCMKAISLAARFANYRVGVFRQSGTDLIRTTRETFFKVCPEQLYDPRLGGNRADSLNKLKFINGSTFVWVHLEDADDNVLRGLELNLAVIDQAEEVSRYAYDILNSRVGRWDRAEIPEDMDASKFPANDFTGKPMAPAYMLLGCNPDSELHWIYQDYHPESDEYEKTQYDHEGEPYKLSDDHVMFQASSYDNPALAKETLRTMLRQGTSFVTRFVEGKWGIPEGAIHQLPPLSIIQGMPEELLNDILTNGTLTRVLDHGSRAPTSCLWFSAYKDWHFCFREYYREGQLISEHRKNIHSLSRHHTKGVEIEERYIGSYADPDIFKKKSEKYGGYWSVSDEYSDARLTEEPIYWSPADNNELLTRNRLDELLHVDKHVKHPITGQLGSPRIFFIKATEEYPNGCQHVQTEIRAQKRRQLGNVSGQAVYSDERTRGIPDHAYDCARYYAGMKAKQHVQPVHRNTEGTFGWHLKNANRHNRIKRQKHLRVYA